MAKFDDIYNEFEEVCEKLDEGVTSEKDLDELKGVIDELSSGSGKDADKKAILSAYAYAHLGNGYFALADHEMESGNEEHMLEAVKNAKVNFEKSLDLFSAIKESNDRDYLLADCYQMFAAFILDAGNMSNKCKEAASGADVEALYKKSIGLYEALLEDNEYDTRDALVDVYFGAGGFYYDNDHKDQALTYFERSKSLAEELDKEEPGSYEEFIELISVYM